MNIKNYKMFVGLPVFMLLLLVMVSTAIAADFKVGFAIAKPPFVFAKSAEDKFETRGIELEIMRKALAYRGHTMTPIYISFSEMTPSLKAGQIDIAATVQKGEESDQYYSDEFVYFWNYAITHPEDEASINFIADLQGRTVAAWQGAHNDLGKAFGKVTTQMQSYQEVPDQEEQVLSFLKKKVDTLVIDWSIFSYWARKHGYNPADYKQHNIFGGKTVFSAAFKDKTLRDDFNEGLTHLKATGQYKEIYEKLWNIQVYEKLALTPEERNWLARHKKIVVGGELDWAPFDFVDQFGQHTGLSNDYLKIIGEMLDLQIDIITEPSWSQLLDKIKRREIDVLPAVYHSTEREKVLNFSERYANVSEFIFTREENNWISGIADLRGKKVAVVAGYTIENLLRQQYPDIELVTAANIHDSLQNLVIGEADAFVGDIASTTYNIKTYSMTGINPVSPAPFPAPSLHMGVRKDWPELASLISKALASIPKDTQARLKSRWFASERSVLSTPEQLTQGVGINLSSEEKAWISANPVVRVQNETDWAPFNYYEYGEPKGLSIDYMNLLASKVGLQVQYVTGPSWGEFLEMIKVGQLDAMLNIVKTPDRLKYLLFTPSYADNPNTILSKKEANYQSLEQLKGKIVSVPKGFFYEEILKREYPEINVLPLRDTLDTIKAVSFGKADAALGELAVFNHLINKHFMTDISITGEIKIGDQELSKLNIATRKDLPILASILRKGVAAISDKDMNQMQRKWLLQKSTPQEAKKLSDDIDTRIWWLIAVILVLAVLIIPAILHRWSEKHHFQWMNSAALRRIGAIVVALFLLSVLVIAWFSLERVNQRIRGDVSNQLLTINHAVKTSLETWLAGRKSLALDLAQDNKIAEITKHLLKLPRDSETLIADPVMSQLRNQVRAQLDRMNAKGIFIISPDRISIASMRDANIGTTNLIAQQRPELMDQAFSGRTVFIPPIVSDVPLRDADGRLVHQAPTMFFASPIFNTYGEVVAVFTVRFDPDYELTKITENARPGKTGETYVVDQNGYLLTASRFDDALKNLAGIERTNFRITDPGGNLLSGFQPVNPRNQWPLTTMAEQVTSGNEGLNIEGYRDYRGVPVLGTWLWSESLGIGITTEMDVEEALAPYYMLRNLVLGALGVTVLLALSLTGLSVWVGDRAKARLESLVNQRTSELEEAQNRNRMILDSAGEGIFGLDTSSRVTFCNQAAADMLGYDLKELLGQDMHEAVHYAYKDGSEYPVSQCRMRDAQKQKQKQFVDDEVLWCKDGTSIPVEYTAVPMSQDGTVVGSVVMFRDISQRLQQQEILASREREFRTLMESAPDPMVVVDEHAVIAMINQRTEEVFGYQREEILGQKIEFLIPERFRTDHVSHRNNYIHHPDTRPMGQDMLLVALNKAGKEFPVEVSLSPIETDRGLLVAASLRDITEREKADALLKSSMERFRVLFDDAADAFLIFDGERFIDCNQATVRLLGYDNKDDILEKSPVEISPEYQPEGSNSFELAHEFIDKAMSEGHALFDWVHLKKDGSEIPIEVTLTKIELGGKDMLLVVYHDLTERKKAEAALKESQERFELAVHGSGDALWEFDAVTGKNWFSPRFVEMLGYEPGELPITLDTWKEHVHPEDIDAATETFIAHLEEDVTYDVEYRMRTKQGQWRWFRARAKSLRDEDGKAYRASGSMSDVTERKEMELKLAEAKNAAEQATNELQEKFDELERFRRMAVGRELKMIELKKEINQYLKDASKAEKYKIVQSSIDEEKKS